MYPTTMYTLYVFLGCVAISCAYDNLALHKPTNQQHQYPHSEQIPGYLTRSSNAVDGLKSLLGVWGGQCVISANGKNTATWWVNLTSIVSIHHITIYYRTGNQLWGPSNGFTSRFLGFSLYISNTTNKSDGTVCFKDTNFTLSTIPAVFNTTCTVHGQYVIFYNERKSGVTYPHGYSTYAFNELCEVEVLGCGELGYYGLNCSIPCPDPNCRYCDSGNGSCQGCKPGYQGHHCELECPKGSYGQNCVKKCSDKCFDCNHVNGSCDSGCSEGWTGTGCKEPCVSGKFGQDCKSHCGKCLVQDGCFHTNGTCLNGCARGYQRSLCKTPCDPGKYGYRCNDTCGQCRDKSKCFHTNGSCLSGCDTGYYGDLCKTANIALHKPTYQEYRYTGLSENLTQAGNAVDGLKSNLSVWGGQCVISDINKHNATWWVNLTSILSIQHITIYYRTGNDEWGPSNTTDSYTSRFLGFSLYVSNTTNKSEGTLCFKDSKFNLSTILAVQNIPCPVSGQYVIYYNERLQGVTYPDEYSTYAFNELCEVEVFGCPEPGYYGPDCSLSCPDSHCRLCHPETGTCQECKPGYQGDHCQEVCTGGKYGYECQEICGHCRNPNCNHVNGACSDGCDPGYSGENCDMKCPKGYYGDDCKEECGYCKDLSQCHYVNGTCLDGCEAGYTGKNCTQPCQNGTYGQNCKDTCGHCLNSGDCFHVNGTCVKGCKPGYQGDLCQTKCESGTYGKKCENRCGRCVNQTDCFHINGTCLKGCDIGYLGNKCKTACRNGTYGPGCVETCGHCRDQRNCHNVNGSCLTGCENGYRGNLCNSVCENGTYGLECNNTCGHCRNEEYCYHTNGTCFSGCDPGYFGDLCKTECTSGDYGEKCSSVCGNCFKGDTCHHVNGSCLYGCSPGYQGSFCVEACENGTYGQDCNNTCGHCLEEGYCEHINGTCFSGCLPGYHGDLCEIQCMAGLFGDNCNGTCGYCSHGDSCHHINGSCLHGCDPNYQGLFCTEAKHYGNPQSTSPVGAVVVVLMAIIIVIVIVIFVIRGKRLKIPKYMKDSASSTDTRKEMSFDNQFYNDAENSLNDKGSILEVNMNQNNSNPYENEHDETNNENSNEQDETYVNVEIPQGIRVKDLESIIARKRADENAGFKEEYAALPSGEKWKCDVGKKPENTSKNRYRTTFPYDHSRVILNVTEKESSDYINANYIDGFDRPKEYIAAQGPKPNTLGDFWRMIWQQDVTTIVMLTNLKEGDKIKCTQYWPDGNKARLFGSISVKMTEEKEYAFFIKRKLSVSHGTLKQTHDVTQYHYTAWPDHGTPEPMNLLDFHHHVMSSTNGKEVPTVVHCSAGVGRTGTFIALDALYREGSKTGLVNVSDFVKKMRQNRVSMVQTSEQYITIFLALNEIFKAPLHIFSALDFCTKTEKIMKDNPANRNPLRKEFQLLLHVKPVYAETDYKMAMQSCKGKQTDKVLPLDKYCVHLCSAVPKRGSYINAIFAPSLINSRRFIVTQYPTPDDAVDLVRLLQDHESDTVICLDLVSDLESSWLPKSNSTKDVDPFTIHCQSSMSGNNGTEHVINIRQTKQGDTPNSVVVFEPKNIINPLGNHLDTSELRWLVSKALSCTSENPITLISSDGASLCGIFMAVHNAIQQLEMDDGVDVFTTVRQLQIRRPELCGNIDEYTMIYKALYDHIQNDEENIYCNQ